MNIIDMEGLNDFQAVAFTDEMDDLGIQILHEEDGGMTPYMMGYPLPAGQNFYDMSFWDHDTGRYYIVAFFKNKVKDLSVEFIYENKEWENEKYIYYFTDNEIKAPAIFFIEETPQYGNMSIRIEPVD